MHNSMCKGVHKRVYMHKWMPKELSLKREMPRAAKAAKKERKERHPIHGKERAKPPKEREKTIPKAESRQKASPEVSPEVNQEERKEKGGRKEPQLLPHKFKKMAL